MNYTYFTKIGLLPPESDLSQFNSEIDEKIKKKYEITEIQILDEKTPLSEISQKLTLLSLLKGTLYITNRKLSDICNHCQKLVIFLFGHDYYLSREIYKDQQNFYLIGLEDEVDKFPLIHIQGAVNINSKFVKFKNIRFVLDNQNGDYYMRDYLLTAGLIFYHHSQSIQMKNCHFNKKVDSDSNIVVFKEQKDVSLKNCQIIDGYLKFDICQSVIIIGNHFIKAGLKYHTSNGVLFDNVFKETPLHFFDVKNVTLLGNQLIANIAHQYSQISLDYSSLAFINNNKFCCFETKAENQPHHFQLICLDRGSKAIVMGNQFEKFESLGKIEWKSCLELISNQFQQSQIDLSYSNSQIRTNKRNFNVNEDNDKEITINLTDKNIIIPDRIVNMIC